MIKTNIRGKNLQLKKAPLDDTKELHDCLDCEGCLCEDLCKEYDDEYFGRKVVSK